VRKLHLQGSLYRRGGIIAGLIAAAGLVVAGSVAASASPSTSVHPQAGPKPTIVLEHGAWATSDSWDGVVRLLQHAGYTVDVPPNPLQGLKHDSAFLADYLHSIKGPIVLVGHSYGGAVITNAATGDKQVKALVYVDAFIPAKGQTLGQLVTAKPGSCVAAPPATIFNFATYPGAPAGVVDAYLKQSVFPSCIANGLPRQEQQVLAATQEPLSTIALTQKSGAPAWKTIPSWAIVGMADHTIPPAELIIMAQAAHSKITMIPHAPHVSMISNPGIVAKVILRAALATS
jgi:pimeloyl-ACP methyl ester carboxylesterase